MARRLTEVVVERRGRVRSGPTAAGWAPIATLRPGVEIVVVNIAARGLLMRTGTRVLPGKRVDLLLSGERGRCAVAGLVLRCQLVALDPICYEAAITVEQDLVVGSDG